MRLVCEEFVFLQTQFFLISMKVKSILISQPKPEIKNSPYVELIKKFKLKKKMMIYNILMKLYNKIMNYIKDQTKRPKILKN